MSQPYDTTFKILAELSPGDWLPLLGLPRKPVSVEDTYIATLLSGAADKVLRVQADPEYLLHFEFESGHDSAALPRRIRMYNGALDYRHDCLVLSVAVLLRPEADSPQATGLFERGFPGEPSVSFLRYHVIRVWQLPVEELLTGGIGTLALAPISNVEESRAAEVVGRMKERLRGASLQQASEVWIASFTLLGLRESKAFRDLIRREVLAMKESATYQEIVAEGKVEEARRFLLRLGQERLGRPSQAARAAVNGMEDVERIEQLGEQLFRVESWEELLGLPAKRGRNRRR